MGDCARLTVALLGLLGFALLALATFVAVRVEQAHRDRRAAEEGRRRRLGELSKRREVAEEVAVALSERMERERVSALAALRRKPWRDDEEQSGGR